MPLTTHQESLLKSLFGKNDKGEFSLRVVLEDHTEEGLENAVGTQAHRSLETILKQAIVLDANGKPALRLAAVPFGKTIATKTQEDVSKRVVEKEKYLKAEAKKHKGAKKAKK